MRVRFTPSADRQWMEALGYICRDRPVAARNLLDRVDQALVRLVAYPESGRFVYRVVDGDIWILAVWHDAQVADEPVD